MLNILIPLAGKSEFFDPREYRFSKILAEVSGTSMIELVLGAFKLIEGDKRFIFVVNKEDCVRLSIDMVLKLLVDDECEVVILDGDTKGAICSGLMAIDFINNDDELLIANGDQIIDVDYNAVLESFRKPGTDAGLIVFESVHPRWSYVRVNEEGAVVETAEKRPISRTAIAGNYYFTKGQSFINAGMSVIKKDASVGGSFYISASFNELVLQNKKIVTYPIEASQYHSFYSPKKIREYERQL